ncbi:MAG: malto-oligosyltrehalose trehalohydrolase [Thermodesulfobacteriota bacterium]|nr:malto-oligosyltrehalose trehalohydrolase [Thermodesulfobacteriota bacterium]
MTSAVLGRSAAPVRAFREPGALYMGDGRAAFAVWASKAGRVDLVLLGPGEGLEAAPDMSGGTALPMVPEDRGWFTLEAEAKPGDLYVYALHGPDRENERRPDPASHYQPFGVHGPSMIVDHGTCAWKSGNWTPFAWEKTVLYELHPGTFTSEGTLTAIEPRLSELRDLGVTAISLMPVAQCPTDTPPGAPATDPANNRNWGYDGVYPFSVAAGYGGPQALKSLVDACHMRGLAVVLDVVYNHLGPEGNYLDRFAHYFTDRYKTPWGRAVNFDDAWSDQVRAFFIANAKHWFTRYRVDGLRLDAVHAITDFSAYPFLEELADEARKWSDDLDRPLWIIPESDLNDPRLLRPKERGGFGHTAQWCDDFHHSLHTLITGEDKGYYRDFGAVEDLARCLCEGFAVAGDYSLFRNRRHGAPANDCPAEQFVVHIQTHDQVGNRMHGERLLALADFEALKLAAACVAFSPSVPMLFMGEEYGEIAPFLYFISHGDPGLVKAVRQGRAREFKDFGWKGEPPDPQAVETFKRSRLDWSLREKSGHAELLAFYREIYRLRRELPALARPTRIGLMVRADEEARTLVLLRPQGREVAACLYNFNPEPQGLVLPETGKAWRKVLDSADGLWAGPGAMSPDSSSPGGTVSLAALSAALYLMESKA